VSRLFARKSNPVLSRYQGLPRLLEHGIAMMARDAARKIADDIIEKHINEYRERLRAAIKANIEEALVESGSDASHDRPEVRVMVKLGGKNEN
jgi:hypothetical protein